MAGSSKNAVLAAVTGNGILTVAKFAVFAVTGSGAMLSEAVHSLADTGNQVLLFLGIRRSERPADTLFPYGYGGARYLYALLSAVGIFVLGCGVSVYHGIHNLLDPPPIVFSWWSVAVLSVSFFIEATVLGLAIRTAAAQKGRRPWLVYLRTTSDPTVAAVLLEDTVACLGVLIAGAGMGLSIVWQQPHWDALAAIAIGGLLGGVAVFLGLRNTTLLLGPSLDPATRRAVHDALLAEPAVASVRSLRSRILGSDRFRIHAEVEFDPAYLAERALARVPDEAFADPGDPEARRRLARALAEAVCAVMAEENDRMEQRLRARFPGLASLETETDDDPLEASGTQGLKPPR